jgi:hypothetical protein
MGLLPTGSGKERAKKGGLKFETIHTHKTRYRGGNNQDSPTPKKYPKQLSYINKYSIGIMFN